MSKQAKETCQRLMTKIETKLSEIKTSIKVKKSLTTIQKLVSHIINDFKFLYDDVTLILNHFSLIQKQSYEKDVLISRQQKQIFNKNAEKKMLEQIMKAKYEKLNKQYQFLCFSGKNKNKQDFLHQRCKSELIKKGLNELQKEIVLNSKRTCQKVKELKNQIQISQQRYLTLQNSNITKNLIQDLDISHVFMQNNLESYRSKQLIDAQAFNPSKSIHSKSLQRRRQSKVIPLNKQDQSTAYQTAKKDFSSNKKKFLLQNQQIQSNKKLQQIQKFVSSYDNFSSPKFDKRNSFEKAKDLIQPVSSQNITINKKKRQQLADLIAQQTKITPSKQQYFSTDI